VPPAPPAASRRRSNLQGGGPPAAAPAGDSSNAAAAPQIPEGSQTGHPGAPERAIGKGPGAPWWKNTAWTRCTMRCARRAGPWQVLHRAGSPEAGTSGIPALRHPARASSSPQVGASRSIGLGRAALRPRARPCGCQPAKPGCAADPRPQHLSLGDVTASGKPPRPGPEGRPSSRPAEPRQPRQTARCAENRRCRPGPRFQPPGPAVSEIVEPWELLSVEYPARYDGIGSLLNLQLVPSTPRPKCLTLSIRERA